VAGALGTEAAVTAGTAATTAGAAASSPAGQRTILWLEEQLPRVEHIMAPKHAWDRLIPLSGNALQDYRAIQPILRQFIETGVRIPDPKGMFVEYRAIIQGQEIVVRVRELANGALEISNAFIQTLPR
jgi:hypothetical protein